MISRLSGHQAGDGSRSARRHGATGVEDLSGAETRFPSGGDAGGWAEFGQIDAYGHAHPDDLPARVQTEVMNAADRIMQLLKPAWKEVRVVTDHGWLLMPGGLPKVELPAYLAATKWSRCAVVKGRRRQCHRIPGTGIRTCGSPRRPESRSFRSARSTPMAA